MSAHGPNLHYEEDSTPNKSFLAWVKSEHSLYAVQLFALVSTIGLFASVAYYLLDISEFITIPEINTIVINAHIFFLALFIYRLIKTFNDDQEKYYHSVGKAYKVIFNQDFDTPTSKRRFRLSERNILQFKKFFLCFWISMFLLYSTFAFRNYSEGKEKYQIITPADTTNCSYRVIKSEDTSSAISFVKVEVRDSSIQSEKPKIKNGVMYTSEKAIGKTVFSAFSSLLPEFITFAMNCISSMFIFWCFSLLIYPPQNRNTRRKQRQYINLSVFCLLLLLTSFFVLLPFFAKDSDGYHQKQLQSYTAFFDAISGVLTCFILALFIARLDSKLIGIKSIWVAILYVYAAVQPLFVVFEEAGAVNEVIKSLVFIIVFLSKIYFFLIIMYALQEGRILNYFYSFPILDSRINSIFNNQFEINIKKNGILYSFNITRKRKLLFVCHKEFSTIADCYKAITEIRSNSEHRQTYKIESFEDTFWIEIMIQQNKICQSIDVRSEIEARELIQESRKMIKYCQVNNAH